MEVTEQQIARYSMGASEGKEKENKITVRNKYKPCFKSEKETWNMAL